MDFSNDTPYEARLFHGAFGNNRQGAWVIARVTFRYVPEEGGLVPARDESWPIFARPLKTDFGTFASDDVSMREGCDLVIVDHAHADEPTPHLVVSARGGGVVNELVVHGDRVWEKKLAGGLVPGPAQPFVDMPLDWTRAFGGVVEHEGAVAGHPLNPAGRGLYTTPTEALGRPLANLEDPSTPVTKWSDSPVPAAWGPIEDAAPWHGYHWFERHARSSPEPPSELDLARAALEFYSGGAAPRMVMPELKAGDPVGFTGLAASPGFEVPAVPLRVRATVGSEVIERTMKYCGLWVL